MSNNKNCDSCDSCSFCYSCSFCDSCSSCPFCFFCFFCSSCSFCSFCYFSSGLRMSEKMLFCLGLGKYETKGEGYQKNYCVFNQKVEKEEWSRIKDSLDINIKLTEWNEGTKSLDVYSYEDAWKNWWDSASDKQKKSITDIKYFNAEIFKGITGIDIEEQVEEMTVEQVCKALGKNIKIVN